MCVCVCVCVCVWATVQVHVQGGFPDLDGFHSSPQPEPFGSSLDCGAFPVDAVVGLLNMNCNTVLGVSSFHCLSVFTQPDFSWFPPRTPLGNPYREFRTPLLSASALGSCSSPALVLFSEFSLV